MAADKAAALTPITKYVSLISLNIFQIPNALVHPLTALLHSREQTVSKTNYIGTISSRYNSSLSKAAEAAAVSIDSVQKWTLLLIIIILFHSKL